MEDCLNAGVSVMTFGQYLRPTKRHLPVKEYVTPEKFDEWREIGEQVRRKEGGREAEEKEGGDDD
jgi:lipoic acid synthetase